MKFESQYKWLEKQAKVLNGNYILLPKTDLIIALNTVSSAIEEYDDNLFLEKKMQLIQLIGINLRNSDKSFFNCWSEHLFKVNTFEKVGHFFNNCKECYNIAFTPSSLRKYYNERLVELHILNNNEVIHCLEKGNMINPAIFPQLVEYFEILTNIDLTGFPELKGVDRKQCKNCK